ncbi:hypothetical protein CYFUS_005411 [Cystobacter fuscus]|uniref:Uncharacterized protein n=1 Tax=Cystobacter fuscus TaxID=43 RepID=A0A250J8P9_9BACT|nr:hypothetical protein [Cystobacter fuscus]ATB39963.1 hypothetical protein CYFUS_005411 [Cystobacter fuscus]
MRKKSGLGLGVVLSFVALGCGEMPGGAREESGPVTRTQAITGDIFASDVFNWRFYLNAHADLLQAGIVTEQGARNHWQSTGISECRRAHPLFHTRQYLEIYPDLKSAFGGDCSAALQHYLNHGRSEGRVGVSVGAYDGRYTVKNDIIAVGGSNRVAGAVDSLYWGGREFISSWDHGRQLQMALSGNGWGECYNPTEAGGEYDGLNATSTSLLQGVSASGSVYRTQSKAAFWLLPGQESGAGPCGGARNTTALSNYTLNKQVTVGYGGLSHVIEFLTLVTVPETLGSMVVEAPTGYLGGEFSAFYTFNPSTCQLAPLSAGPGEQGLPVVLSTPDGTAAMGAWSPDLPQSGLSGSGYGRFAFPDSGRPANATHKWNVVFRRGSTPPGSYDYRAYIAVGSLENVRVSLCQVVSLVH